MAGIEWKAAYSVGDHKLDQDHRHMFALMNELDDALSVRPRSSVISQILKALVHYADHHFADEERAMRNSGYPAHDDHCKEHLTLGVQAQTLEAEYENGNTQVAIEVLYFLSSWLENHILHSDVAYAEFLRNKRVGELA